MERRCLCKVPEFELEPWTEGSLVPVSVPTSVRGVLGPHDLAVLALGMRRPSGAEAAIKILNGPLNNMCEAESQVTRKAEKPPCTSGLRLFAPCYPCSIMESDNNNVSDGRPYHILLNPLFQACHPALQPCLSACGHNRPMWTK